MHWLNKHYHFPTRWEAKFFCIALEVESWSKHPHTKVGCVVIDDDHIQLAGGLNGLPRGVDDNKIREQTASRGTNSITVHAEANAVAAAARKGTRLMGSTALVTRPVCSQCAALLIQAGVQRVLALDVLSTAGNDGYSFAKYGEWAENLDVAFALLLEAGVDYKLVHKATWLSPEGLREVGIT